jgi:hypothetical protein
VRPLVRSVVLAVAALILTGTLVELTCVAGERSHHQPAAAPRLPLSPEPPTVDPPSVSEIDADEVPETAAQPALSR